jgi:hypothetical protein
MSDQLGFGECGYIPVAHRAGRANRKSPIEYPSGDNCRYLL